MFYQDNFNLAKPLQEHFITYKNINVAGFEPAPFGIGLNQVKREEF